MEYKHGVQRRFQRGRCLRQGKLSCSVECLRRRGASRLSARRGRRCLTLQPPSPEDKLATLSDIAQEYSVEWDAHAAASEMLPPSGAQPPYGAGGPLVRWGACQGAARAPSGVARRLFIVRSGSVVRSGKACMQACFEYDTAGVLTENLHAFVTYDARDRQGVKPPCSACEGTA
jgi:hypothetical protein